MSQISFIERLIRIYHYLSRFINVPAAFGGALFMGTAVWVINSDHGVWPAMVAALKQAAYTFFAAGLFVRFLYYQVTAIQKRNLAIALSVITTSLITIGLIFVVHSLRGTPKPFYSTLVTIVLSPFGYLGLAIRKRRMEDKRKEDDILDK